MSVREFKRMTIAACQLTSGQQCQLTFISMPLSVVLSPLVVLLDTTTRREVQPSAVAGIFCTHLSPCSCRSLTSTTNKNDE
mmetsp:Transcript_7673/g.12935  ORF Transcript_7673/g.12935 Transcript_7673/m.12935 type:complete len:81 (-) Transcript_7673:42-284(-)